MSVFFENLVATAEAKYGRHATSGMTRHKQVIFAFVRIGIAHQSPACANRRKLLVTSGYKFVRIDLMTRVPNQSIFAKIVHRMQTEAQLDDAQVRCEMRGPRGN